MDLAAHDLAKTIAPAERDEAKTLMTALKKDSAVFKTAERHWAAVLAFRAAFQLEQRAGLDRAKLAQCQAAFKKLASDFADLPEGQRAAKDVERLVKNL